MRILHVTPYYAPAWSYGGVVSAVTGLAEAQAERGHSVTILTTDALSQSERNPLRRERIGAIDVIRCRNLSNTLRSRYNLSLPPGVWATFRELVRDVDIVHTHELRTVENLLISHVRPVILSPHGTLSHATGRSTFKQTWDSLFGQSLLRKIDGIAALTNAEVDDSRALWKLLNVPIPVIQIIPNGVAAGFAVSGDLRPRYGLGDGLVVLFLGRLHERKGLRYLIPAFAEATHDLPQARLLIVGPDEGMLAAAKTLAAETGIAERVTFTGLLQGADQRAALATADLFVLPAVGEGLSMAALEAMAAGLPLIVTPGCNLPNVEKRGAGLLVAREIELIAGAIRALLHDQDRRAAMGTAGRAWVQESFTWPAIAAQTEALYAQVSRMRQ
ncbi:MAG: glycosyltransferase [Chloroflexota bacterium]